jgi:hypothetical protein
MMETSSPALLVWMMRTVLAAKGKASKSPRCIQRGRIAISFMVVKRSSGLDKS